MRILEWIENNKDGIDWNELVVRWDKMQMVHNPYRNNQLETIYYLSGVQSIVNPKVLDLGCGPGTLAKFFLERKEDIEFVAVDIDPFLLAVFKNSSPLDKVVIIQKDFRNDRWFEKYSNYFDAVVSLTSLHWLSQGNQKALYRRIYSVLRDGGIFLNGDPYLPTNEIARCQLTQLQNEKTKTVTGETWDEYWNSIYSEYGIKAYLDEMKEELFHWEDFEGSDDGYSVDFYLESLREAGFQQADVYWQGGLRIVYGGLKIVKIV